MKTKKIVEMGDFANFSKNLELQSPIQRGIINDWNDIEDLWIHTFSELNVDSSESIIMMSQAALTPINHREKIAQIMFEGFGVQGLDLMMQSLLNLYYSGQTNGLCVDCGYGLCQIVPI